MWFLNIILYFSIYSFFGWICEVIYCSIPAKKFINRGFLKGPVCPVYGFGAMFVIYIMKWINIKSTILVFIFGGLIASIIEFIADILLEYVFHTRLWNYSDRKFNIKGRVCLLNSTLFAVLSVILIKIVHPFVLDIVVRLSSITIIIISSLCVILFFIDLVLTVREVINLNITLKNMNILEEIKKELKLKNHKRFIEAFPQLEHKKYMKELKKLKELIKESMKNNKKV
ncbi:putative ABC transporter permease [Clostridium tertium]|uniref:putative ABC transporter permease n=1 Tax=Clostridium tertium TaxID=1559 RepID=UPI001AE3979C|nr:putative ABC transporter permease [Clostridium tertium]MBP1866858.1 putative membrane protein [Clostridium tertium]